MIAGAPHLQAGREAEAFALNYLQQQGLSLIAQNWICKRGELDLVMLDGDTVVFVEVRYRRHAGWGGALESVDIRKREKLVVAAQYFLQHASRWADSPCRFDVIGINGNPGKEPSFNWLQNAFDS
ncbi:MULTISPECIES: YraN family protein [unclassified Pseudomonas]|uniref:YraN family protein n=1 Tax=unclassified Pseudomonas TaxID=196821 RepID=UPI002AC97DB0|nr:MULTISPECIES: YraN family protein [unclassified Pseudomonas]MEB0038944.1 YraN family protein [Pseudomonas sp. MH10]MEB0075469.1 YraN family protein [Pseudomonas sp. MH10out]MEB0091047.1 YraN family protein [Pseudomonas sp. CCI4.2]MEB0103401.1 YraN family protein [Pseudomonas sp. CCI3.2]MEB0120108.1 YraN family protein [Pseudomonas sp. CCI1.2]